MDRNQRRRAPQVKWVMGIASLAAAAVAGCGGSSSLLSRDGGMAGAAAPTAGSPGADANGDASAGAGGAGGAATPTGAGGSSVVPVADVGATCGPSAGASLSPGLGGPFPPDSKPVLNFGLEVAQAVPPPAISGGTLLVLAGGRTVAAADPDRDQVYLVDLVSRTLTATVALAPGDEPGRIAQDAKGLVHVALRRGGGLATIDPVKGTLVRRTAVCAAPRGIAYDAANDLLHVACAGGELVSLPATGGPAARKLLLGSDLRDVVVSGGELRVTRFRSAEMLRIDATGAVIGRVSPSVFRSASVRGGQAFSPALAWRAVGLPDGGVLMAHQRGCDDIVQHGGGSAQNSGGGYGDGQSSCSAIVHSTVTRVTAAGSVLTGPAFSDLPLPVDLAVSPDGATVAVVSAANGHTAGLPTVQLLPTSGITSGPLDENDACHLTGSPFGCQNCGDLPGFPNVEAIAVAFTPDGSLVVQTREPATLLYGSQPALVLSTSNRADTGHKVFHANAGAGLACASCHAEGLDDGRSWNFACVGARRTQSLQTGIGGTEPFHWNGDEKDFPTLVHDVFTMRMSGPELSDTQMAATLAWIDGQPRRPHSAPDDDAAVERGKAVFSKAACTTCHMGAHLTNGQTVDVGTGGMFQVPSLVGLADHPPYMHNGCAAKLADRFQARCGGGDKHGITSTLSVGELADLLSYLQTL